MSLIFLLVTWVGNYCKIFFSKKKIIARFIFLPAQMQDLVLCGVYTQSYLLMEIESSITLRAEYPSIFLEKAGRGRRTSIEQ